MNYKDPIKYNNNYNLYKFPEKDHVYVACVDVSEGTGKDYSTIVIIDVTTTPYEQVYQYRNNTISPWDFSSIIYPVVCKYNNAHLIVENNSIGKIVADEMVLTYDYENMVSSKIDWKNDEVVSFYNIGIRMTSKTKSVGCAALKFLIENNTLQLNDWITIQELSSFIKVNKSYQAEKNKHDDTITPLIQFAWVTTQDFFEELSSIGMRQLVDEKKRESDESSHTIFGFYDDGITEDDQFQVFANINIQ